ncbi:hypothetical protein KSF78_0006438 [Schistosoma japonicum]|nr:hypothetical protein KSF78_0006438 [Schistosoma japonicum]
MILAFFEGVSSTLLADFRLSFPFIMARARAILKCFSPSAKGFNFSRAWKELVKDIIVEDPRNEYTAYLIGSVCQSGLRIAQQSQPPEITERTKQLDVLQADYTNPKYMFTGTCVSGTLNVLAVRSDWRFVEGRYMKFYRGVIHSLKSTEPSIQILHHDYMKAPIKCTLSRLYLQINDSGKILEIDQR